jgi:hypothetical protein
MKWIKAVALAFLSVEVAEGATIPNANASLHPCSFRMTEC